MLTQMSTPFANYLLTGAIAGFGDAAVAGWAVVNRVTVVAFGGIFSLSGAIGGIFGQNFGAGLYARLMSTYRDALIFGLIYTLLAWVILYGSRGAVIAGFDLGPEGALVYEAFGTFGAGAFLLVSALFVSNAAFNNLGRPGRSTLVNWLRDGVLILPAALYMGAIWGAPGVVYAQALVGAAVGLLSAVWGWVFVRGFLAPPRASLDADTPGA